jgi:GDP-4-dehydro-6-deoxy-D-mannose reductase
VYRPVSAENPYVGENAPLEPSTAYGVTKLEAERRFQACVQQGLDGVVARAFHHCGPRQSPRMVLPDWVRQFVRDDTSTIQVHTLDAYLDLCDVRDVVRAYVLLAQRAELGATYNVGSGICRRSGDVFERLRAIAGPTRKVLETAPGRRQQPIAVIDRLKRATGWRPQIPLQQTLADTLDYWRQVQPAAE